MSATIRQERKAQRLKAQAEDAEILAAMNRGDEKIALRLIHEQHGPDCGCANCSAYAELLTAEKAEETTARLTDQAEVSETRIAEIRCLISTTADVLASGCPSCAVVGTCQVAIAPLAEILERSEGEELRSIGRDLRPIVAMLGEVKRIPPEPYNTRQDGARCVHRQNDLIVIQAALESMRPRFNSWFDAHKGTQA